MPVSSEDTFVLELMKALGIPKRTSAFSLHVAVDKPLVVECTYLPNPKDYETVLTERFTLERIVEQEPAA